MTALSALLPPLLHAAAAVARVAMTAITGAIGAAVACPGSWVAAAVLMRREMWRWFGKY